jgi:hypothetical protein
VLFLEFDLSGRHTTNEYATLCEALGAARNIMATLPETLKFLKLAEGRWGNYRTITTFLKPLAP